MEVPVVSICMPAYNAEDYVAAALDSVLGQTWSNLEIIVVNDGSTDGTAGVLDRYSDEARVTVIHQENQGAAAARNRGFEASTGDYIQYLDADDLLHPRKVEAQMAVLDDHTSETVAVCSTVYFQDGDPPEQGPSCSGGAGHSLVDLGRSSAVARRLRSICRAQRVHCGTDDF